MIGAALKTKIFNNYSLIEWNDLLLNFDPTINYTSWFLNYVEVLNSTSEIQNHTFVVYDENVPISIVPLYIEKISGLSQISMGQEPVYAPIFNKNISISEKYHDYLLKKISDIALQNQCLLARFHASPLLNYHLYPFEYLNAGYVENIFYPDWYIFKSKFSFVLNLLNTKEHIFNRIRKGHRSNIRQTIKIANLIVIDKNTYTEELFSRYISLYYKVKGEKRNIDAFRLDSIAIKSDLQFIMICEYNNEFEGAIAFHTYNNKARYNSSVQLYNKNIRIHPTHFLLWSGIEYLQKKGYELLEIGDQVKENNQFSVSLKEKNLSHFKAGWGSDVISNIKVQKEFKNV
tara:strand:- start:116 stop:1150 length:1035 start_codon:yes stop_codon:yes gene_type:complete